MDKRNILYKSKHEVEVALGFLVIVFCLIFFSGCMRDLQPGLDPINPELTGRNKKESSCCCTTGLRPAIEDSSAASGAMLDIRYSTNKTGAVVVIE